MIEVNPYRKNIKPCTLNAPKCVTNFNVDEVQILEAKKNRVLQRDSIILNLIVRDEKSNYIFIQWRSVSRKTFITLLYLA